MPLEYCVIKSLMYFKMGWDETSCWSSRPAVHVLTRLERSDVLSDELSDCREKALSSQNKTT